MVLVALAAGVNISLCLYSLYKLGVPAQSKEKNVIYIFDESTRDKDSSSVASPSPLNDTSDIIKSIRDADPALPIKVIISTNGGSLIACQRIVTYLRMHPSKFVVYCNEAYSAGTVISLCAEEVVMNKYSLMSKIDPVCGTKEEIIYYLTKSDVNNKKRLTKFDYAVKRSIATLNTVEKIFREAMPLYNKLENIIKEKLIYSELRHFTSFNADEIKAMGFNIREPRDDEEKYFGYFQAK